MPETFAAPSTRVLVVEDDPVVRRLLRMHLCHAGLGVTEVGSGEEALNIARMQPGSFSVLLTDGVMPGMDGFELARCMLDVDPAVRVILISGYLGHFVSRPDIPENIDAFFAKPFSGSELAAKVLELSGITV